MPPPAAAEVAVDQFADVLALLDELLLHPPASTAMLTIAPMATPVFFRRTFPPLACMTVLGRDASIVAREGKGQVSAACITAIRFMKSTGMEGEFLCRRLLPRYSDRINCRPGNVEYSRAGQLR